MRRRTHRDQGKTASEEGMPSVSDFDFRCLCLIRVLEQGIELWDRLILSTMKPCCPSCEKEFMMNASCVSLHVCCKLATEKSGVTTRPTVELHKGQC